MWIFLPDAFLSIVADRDDDLLVRARFPGDIKRVFPRAEVIRTPYADYLYRAVVPRAEVAAALAARVDLIDYVNYKNAVPKRFKKLREATHRVWSFLYFAQNASAPSLRTYNEQPPY